MARARRREQSPIRARCAGAATGRVCIERDGSLRGQQREQLVRDERPLEVGVAPLLRHCVALEHSERDEELVRVTRCGLEVRRRQVLLLLELPILPSGRRPDILVVRVGTTRALNEEIDVRGHVAIATPVGAPAFVAAHEPTASTFGVLAGKNGAGAAKAVALLIGAWVAATRSACMTRLRVGGDGRQRALGVREELIDVAEREGPRHCCSWQAPSSRCLHRCAGQGNGVLARCGTGGRSVRGAEEVADGLGRRGSEELQEHL